MICPECGFKNTTGANFCGKCNKHLENLRFSSYFKSSSKKYFLSTEFKGKTSALLKLLILMFAVIGISGVVSAYPVTGNSLAPNLHVSTVQNGTVYIENGFSGVVKIKDPTLHKSVNVKVNYEPFSTGSGSIVTKNGYIITAFHVISDSKTLDKTNTLKKMDSGDVKWYVEEQALSNYLKKNPELAHKLFKNTSNQDLRKKMDDLTDKFIKKGWISTKSYKMNIKVKGLGLNRINSKNSLNASLVDIGDSKKDQDIALLKVDSKGKKLPALVVSSKDPKIGENISIYGYPGVKMEKRLKKHGKNKQSASKSEDYTPFVTSGHLTAKKPNSHGTVYYRTSAVTAEGYSGGPVINKKKHVTGVLVYGISNAKSKDKVIASLFLSSKYIKKICSKNKVPITVA